MKASPEVITLRKKYSNLTTYVKQSNVAKGMYIIETNISCFPQYSKMHTYFGICNVLKFLNFISEMFNQCQRDAGIEKPLAMKQYCKTRFNSFCGQLKRAKEVERPLIQFIHQASDPTIIGTKVSNAILNAPNAQDWKIAGELIDALQPLLDLTIEFSAEKHITVSKVIPVAEMLMNIYPMFDDSDELLEMIQAIENAPEEPTDDEDEDYEPPAKKVYVPGMFKGNAERRDNIVPDFKKKIGASVRKRLRTVEDNPIYAKATLLDPCLKEYGFFSGSNKVEAAKNMVIEEAIKLIPETEIEPIEPSVEKTVDVSANPPSNKPSYWDNIQKRKEMLRKERIAQAKPDQTKNDQRSKVEKELEHYLSLDTIDKTRDPIEWWVDFGQDLCPILFEVAMKYLIIPATSIPSERIFSLAGRVINRYRVLLGKDISDDLIKLNKNLTLADLK